MQWGKKGDEVAYFGSNNEVTTGVIPEDKCMRDRNWVFYSSEGSKELTSVKSTDGFRNYDRQWIVN